MNKASLFFTGVIIALGTILRVAYVPEWSFWGGYLPSWWWPVWQQVWNAFGQSSLWLSITAGSLLMIVVYELVASISTVRGGQLAALLVAVSPVLIFHSRSLELWPVLSLLSSLPLICWTWWVARDINWWRSWTPFTKLELLGVGWGVMLGISLGLWLTNLISFHVLSTMLLPSMAVMVGWGFSVFSHTRLQHLYVGVVVSVAILTASRGWQQFHQISPLYHVANHQALLETLHQLPALKQVRYLDEFAQVRDFKQLQIYTNALQFSGEVDWSQPLALVSQNNRLDQYPNAVILPLRKLTTYVITP